MSGRRVIILGAGPAGLGAAMGLAERGFDVEVIETTDHVGGNSGSFELEGIHCDYGSHRLHPASDPAILSRIRDLLGDDLLERPRHGRIRLLGRWIHFPLRPVDLLLRMHPRFSVGVGFDLARKLLPVAKSDQESFATILQHGLGNTICQEFYFPYARKMWGEEPEALSANQARKRVSAGSIGKMIRRLLPGGTGSGAANTKGIFYYPREGFGQISNTIRDAASRAGARFSLETRATRVAPVADGYEVEVERNGEKSLMRADRVWSTIPNGILARLLDPAAPADVVASSRKIEVRAMLLIYLVLDTDQFSEYDAHYFPGADISITRLSEPKNYPGQREPRGRTVLCAELPCAQSDDVWTMDNDVLGQRVARDLETAGLPLPCEILDVVVKRLPAAYPIYHTGYELHFEKVDHYLSGVPGLLSFGRQGLFAHDNTHHALFMAQCAVECLRDDGSFDDATWAKHRAVFESHVVED
jgi:protoporphyrinogen oxidase